MNSSAFIDPYGKNEDEIRQLTTRVTEMVLDHLCNASTLPPMPPSSSQMPQVSLPEAALTEDEILENIDRLLKGAMNPANPGFIGHMDSMPATFSVLGELVSAAVNNNMLSLEMSPLFSRLESALMKALANLFGLGSGGGGVMLSGGTLANIQALTVARNSHFQSGEQGLSHLQQPPVLFASEAAHTSLRKAAMLLGLGPDAVIPVAVNANSQMEIDSLIEAVTGARQEGLTPFCVVATAGTTTTGNIDPLPQIGRVAREQGLWFHVDAAYGGALAFSDRHRTRLAGIEEADSITFNPQKWLYVAKTCATVLFRDMNVLTAAFRVDAPYMQADESFINLGEISIQGTRHAEVVKLWLTLQQFGMHGIATLIDNSYTLTIHFVDQVRKRSFLELAGEPDMNLVCFRGVPTGITTQNQDEWNLGLQTELLRQHRSFLSLPTYRNARWLRAVLLNPFTGKVEIDRLFDAVDRFASG